MATPGMTEQAGARWQPLIYLSTNGAYMSSASLTATSARATRSH